MKRFLAYLSSGLTILICAGVGTLIAYTLVDALGWEKTPAVIATLLLSMLLAFALFAAGVLLRNTFRKRE